MHCAFGDFECRGKGGFGAQECGLGVEECVGWWVGAEGLCDYLDGFYFFVYNDPAISISFVEKEKGALIPIYACANRAFISGSRTASFSNRLAALSSLKLSPKYFIKPVTR